jgi:hypothetical protein
LQNTNYTGQDNSFCELEQEGVQEFAVRLIGGQDNQQFVQHNLLAQFDYFPIEFRRLANVRPGGINFDAPIGLIHDL